MYLSRHALNSYNFYTEKLLGKLFINAKHHTHHSGVICKFEESEWKVYKDYKRRDITQPWVSKHKGLSRDLLLKDPATYRPIDTCLEQFVMRPCWNNIFKGRTKINRRENVCVGSIGL